MTTRVLTKICAQYERPTGLVARRMEPAQNAHIEMTIIIPGWTLLIKRPVTIAAMAPEMATGEFLAAARRMESPCRTSRNCLLSLLIGHSVRVCMLNATYQK